jgi:pimeloyl-ACP methyl ester carboxylesterase
MGRSLGANPALEVASNAAARFRGLVIESGAGNIRRSLARTGLIETELGARLAHAHERKIASIRLPALLIHGEVDTLVPLSTAEALREMLTGTTVQLEVIAHAGHNDILWLGRDRYFEVIADLVRRTA